MPLLRLLAVSALALVVTGLPALGPLGARRADAAALAHYDLAGLILQSEAVVLAERLGPATPATPATPAATPATPATPAARLTRYRILRVLRGALAAATPARTPSSRRARIRRRTGSPPRRRSSCPGSRPRSPPPEPASIASAPPRPTAIRPGAAAIFALFPPPGGATAGFGFYDDVLAHEAQRVLGTTDLESALELALRDRGTYGWFRDYSTPAALTAFATDATRRADLRAAAIAAIREHSNGITDAAANRALIALVTDPDPRVRAAAITASAQSAQVTTSDARLARQLAATAAAARAAIARQYAAEQDPLVLHAIAVAYADALRASLPTRRGGPAYVARARIQAGSIDVDVRCLRAGLRIAAGAVTSKPTGSAAATTLITAFNVFVNCPRGGGVSGGASTSLAPGRYELAVELVTPKPVALPLGILTVDASRELVLTPP